MYFKLGCFNARIMIALIPLVGVQFCGFSTVRFFTFKNLKKTDFHAKLWLLWFITILVI